MGWTEKDLKSKGLKYTDKVGERKRQKLVEKVETMYEGMLETRYTLFIEGEVPSSKNSRQFRLKCDKEGNPIKKPNGKLDTILDHSDAVKKYIKNTADQYQELKFRFLRMIQEKPLPLRIGYKLVRGTKAKLDAQNMIHIVADLMKENEWIPDDDVTNTLFIPLTPEYNKGKAGVLLIIL